MKKRLTYKEILQIHDAEIKSIRESCKHDKVKCSLDHSCIGRGSSTASIEVSCVYCGETIYINGLHGDKDKEDLIQLLELGIIRLNWNREHLVYRCDQFLFTPKDYTDLHYIRRKLREGRLIINHH